MTTKTTITLTGTVIGTIWMPCAECWKDVNIDNGDFRFSDGGKPTARDFALKAVCDGDFRQCKLSADSEFTFRKNHYADNGRLAKTTWRTIPASAFPSISDMIDERSHLDI